MNRRFHHPVSPRQRKITPSRREKLLFDMKAAQDYAKAAGETVARYASFNLIASIAILILISTAGMTVSCLTTDIEALEFANGFRKGGDLRLQYSCYCASEFPGKASRYDYGRYFSRYKKHELKTYNVQGSTILDLFNEASQATLNKAVGPINDLIARLTTYDGDLPLFSIADDLPFNIDDSMPVQGFLETLLSEHNIKLLNIEEFDKAVHKALDALMKGKPGKLGSNCLRETCMYNKDGLHLETIEGAPEGYEVDPRFPMRKETHDLKGRSEHGVEFPFSVIFSDERFVLIHRNQEIETDFLEYQLRYSRSRPKMFEGNAYEDSRMFMEEYRWPLISQEKKGVIIRWNKYEDLYLIFRFPIITRKLMSPMQWAQKECLSYIDPSRAREMEKRIRLLLQRIRDNGNIKTFHDYLRNSKNSLSDITSKAHVPIFGLSVPLPYAIPGVGLLLAFLTLAMFYHCRRIEQLITDGLIRKQDILFFSSIMFHRGKIAYLYRLVVVFMPLIVALVSSAFAWSLFKASLLEGTFEISIYVFALTMGAMLVVRLSRITRLDRKKIVKTKGSPTHLTK
jgi:hypothetical protein